MLGSMAFPDRGCQTYDDPYGSGNEDTNHNSQRRRRLFAAHVQREAFMRARHGQPSQFTGLPNFQSPFTGRGALHSHMMGHHPQSGVSSPQAMNVNMGMGGMGSIGAMGRDPGIGLGMRMATNMHCPSRSSFLQASQMGYRQTPLFDSGSLHRTRTPFFIQHRHCGQASWSRTQHGPFSATPSYATSFFSDDEDDESDWDEASVYVQPRRRRFDIRSFGRAGHRAPSRSRWMYDGYEDEDNDEESDFEYYHPLRRERLRH